MPTITVFTPSYNRARTLQTLFDSLLRQTYRDFEWIIVDDGSADETPEVVERFMQASPFKISYIYKKNEGKHIAINHGVSIARGKWFFIVDSDDYLVDNALERIKVYCDEIESDTSFAGVVGLRGNGRQEAWLGWYRKKGGTAGDKESIKVSTLDCDHLEYRYKYKLDGDRAEVVRTELLKKYPFPQYGNEKFLVESYLWLSLARDNYKFRWFHEIVYITEYLEDGLTRNIAKHYKESPMGTTRVANLRLSCKGVPFKERVRNSYNYYRYGMIAGMKIWELYCTCSNKMFTIIGLPLALLRK